VLRPVRLPEGVEGRLYLVAMPGARGPLERTWEGLRKEGVHVVVCLAEPEEIRAKSPAYAAALEAQAVPCPVESFPVADFGVPDDREAFWALACRVGKRLTGGERVAIHCGAGIGRTGMLGACVLLALGQPPAKAEQAVSAAGSHPETAAQRALVSWCAGRPASPLI
jgi:protein-tyrosine phosphatase